MAIAAPYTEYAIGEWNFGVSEVSKGCKLAPTEKSRYREVDNGLAGASSVACRFS